MSKFHSTVSRREFMKGLGVAGAGVGAAALAGPAFHDMDELMASEKANFNQPWFVKTLDHYKPTADTDWTVMKPFTCNTQGYNFGVNTTDAASVAKKKDLDDTTTGFFKSNKPGFDLRQKALSAAASGLGGKLSSTDFTGYTVTTPEAQGVSKWSGSPEENANTLRAAFRYLGMPEVGFLELDDNARKMFPAANVRFEDADAGRLDGKTQVYPNKAKYLIVSMVRKDVAITKAGGAHPWGYDTSTQLGRRAQMFVKSLGYQAYSVSGYDNCGYGVLTGQAELGRIAHSVTPKYGTAIRLFNILATDLPLPASQPIDAGIYKFCYTCKLCAEVCHEYPNTALSLETEPSYELPNNLNLAGGNTWNRPGVKRWAIDYPSCGICYVKCHWNCVFNQLEKASVHALVRATSAITPVFNGFFTQMDKAFGFDITTYEDIFEGMEGWWDRNLNSYKYDTALNGDNL